MPRDPVRHGCLGLAVSIILVAFANGQNPVAIRSRVFDIEYAVNESALPLDSVQLWYTLDRGASWYESSPDEDRQSPITFTAPQEGLYGFFLVLTNATGPSSMAPTRTTQPHQWTFVDYTPPVVQLHPPRQTTILGQRVVQLRWTAIDANFGPRPVEVAYQRPPDETWYPATSDPLTNTGRYDWRLPEDISTSVAVRLTVTDLGEHRGSSERRVLDITPAYSERRSEAMPTTTHGAGVVTVGDTTALSGSARAKQRAKRLYAEALDCRKRGDYRDGVARLREAVKLDPQWAEAFAEMADMLYGIGDLDRALNAYELALRRQPAMRSALRGAAMVCRQKNDHLGAARLLRTILRYNPNDAEVWMNLGDIAIYQGDEVLARECYTRATQIDPEATQVIADAQKRLELMAEVSRRYQPNGK